MLHLDIEHVESAPVETSARGNQRGGERKAEGLYSGPSRLEANLGLRESRREIRNGIKSYGHKGTDLGP